MTEAEYAQQLSAQGYSVHFSDGVWWVTVVPGFCRPVWRISCLPRNKSTPRLSKSFLGYGYSTSDEESNASPYRVMLQRKEQGTEFDIEQFSKNRRRDIRRGLRHLDVYVLEDVSQYLLDMTEIVISARIRTGAGRSVEYYQNHGEKWRSSIQNIGKQKDNYFVGAFFEQKLIAYFCGFKVNDTFSIAAAKSHSDYLNHNPNDALIYKTLDLAYTRLKCDTVIYGDYSPEDLQLNDYKTRYGFQCHEVPQYEHHRLGMRFLKRLRKQR